MVYKKGQGYMNLDKAFDIWKERNPKASHTKMKNAKWLLKYNVSVNSGLLMKPEDFG